MPLALPLFLACHASLSIVLLSAVCSGRPVSFLIWSVHLIGGLPGGLFALKLRMIWKMHCWLGACLHDQSILVVWIEYIRQLSSVHWVGDGCTHFLDVGEGLLRGLYTSSRKLVKIVFHFREVSMSLTHKWLLVILMFSIGASWDSCQYLI